MWGLIPMIKRELVLKLSRDYKLTKVVIADKLGITKGSVTQYIQGKRASNSASLRKVNALNQKIKSLAGDLAAKKLTEDQIAKKFCGICKVAQKKIEIC
jgi:predicted transcriptional regulator